MEKPTPSIKFYGADTDKWIGRILSNDAQKTQIQGGGFGLRYKVAIMGYHTSDEGELKNEDITYALVRLGVTDGTGAGGRMRSPRLTQGDVVTGEFLDGAARQQPIITGALGRVGGERKGKGRFESKTGFWGGLKPGNLLERDEANETSTPPCVPKAIPKGSGSDKTDKRETDKESLKAAGIDPDGEPKVGEVKKPEGNGLTAEEQAEILKEQQTGTVKTDEQLQAEEGGTSNTVPTEEVETREQRQAREDREAAQALLDSGEFLF
jgi:hypothetical protein